MHFSVPDTQELYAESTGATYTAYNIYINGSYHCCLRYKQLHALHEQLRRNCCELGAEVRLPSFPPKRLLPLTPNQLETRRAALEHYLQLVGQDIRIAKLDYLQNFLLSAQHESAVAEGALDDYGADAAHPLPVQVLLMNGYQLQVNFRVRENSSALLQQVCHSLQLPLHLVRFFCLYLVRKEAPDSLVLLRRLMDFESPFLSRLRARPPCQILLRTGYWHATHDLKLLQDTVALNLLFIQTAGDVAAEWVIATPEVRQKLRALQEHGLKKEYMEMACQLPLYGCLQFETAIVDYPEPQTSALISIGSKELSMRTAKGAKIYETKFRVTRMRCWRVTALHNTTLDAKDEPANLQLSFEYLMSKQTLRWITITSTQAMLMSVCLQAMVDELLNCQDVNPKTELTPVAHINASPTQPPRNGRISQSNTLSSSSSTPSFSNEATISTSTSTSTSTTNSNCSSTSSPTAAVAATGTPVQFLSQRCTKSHSKVCSNNSYSAVFFRNAQEESVQNEAFEAFIGDDDL